MTTTRSTPTRWPTACERSGPGSRSIRPTSPFSGRVAKAKVLKIPYILVVGDDDVSSGTVGVNRRGSNRPERGVELAAFTEQLESRDRRATNSEPT